MGSIVNIINAIFNNFYYILVLIYKILISSHSPSANKIIPSLRSKRFATWKKNRTRYGLQSFVVQNIIFIYLCPLHGTHVNSKKSLTVIRKVSLCFFPNLKLKIANIKCTKNLANRDIAQWTGHCTCVGPHQIWLLCCAFHSLVKNNFAENVFCRGKKSRLLL